MPLTVIKESIETFASGVLFRCDCGDGEIACGISGSALRDLIDFHRIKTPLADAARVLLPEMERLANAKCDTGRFEEDGGILIRPTDILRYGFQRRKKRAA